MVMSAAIRFNNKIYTGKSHYSIMQEILKEFPTAKYPIPDDQGFVDDKGNYLRREHAMVEALKCKQVEKGKTFNPRELFSEDIIK
jgi:hypothetical protein